MSDRLLDDLLEDQTAAMFLPEVVDQQCAEINRLRDVITTFAFRVEYMTEELSRYTALVPVKQKIQREIKEARAALHQDGQE